MVRIDRYKTTQSFYNLFRRHFPQAIPDRVVMRLALALLTTTWHDKEQGTERLVLPSRRVAELAGKLPQFENNNFKAKSVLARFEALVVPLNASEWRYTEEKARTVLPTWPPELLEAWHGERQLSPQQREAQGAVYFVSGKTPSLDAERRAAKKELEAIRRQWEELDHPGRLIFEVAAQGAEVVRSLVKRNFELALTAASEFEKSYALNVLYEVANSPVPIYVPSEKGRTVRLFGYGCTFLTAPSAVRKALLQGCWEFDLVSAQLAIAASLWDVPKVLEFLASGGNIWHSLAEHCGVDLAWAKLALKVALYSVLYGAGEKRIRHELAFGGKAVNVGIGLEGAERFLSHPLIAVLLKARATQLTLLERQGYAETVFGERIPVPHGKAALSALAQQAQAAELEVLLPAVRLMRDHKDIRLVAWQHDGFTVYCTDATKRDRYARQLVELVGKEIEKRGYLTRLERVFLGPERVVNAAQFFLPSL